jgi:hypothetical protein
MNNMTELKTRNMMRFMGWLQNFNPEMHALVVERIGEAPANDALTVVAEKMNGLGQFDLTAIFGGEDEAAAQGTTETTATPWWESAIDAVKSTGTAVLQYKTQQDLIDLQMKRIEEGKPPIDTALISPTVRVQADLPPAIQADIRDMKRTAIFAVGGIALAIMAFLMFRKKR